MKQAYRFLLLASVIALLLGTAAACGSRVYKAPAKGAVPLEPKAYTFQDTLSELDALEKPEGVDEKVWGELTGALREALESRARTNDGSAAVSAVINGSEVGGRDTRPTDRIVSSPPTGAANKVNDLTATRETNGDFTLSWHYRNLGDYDQNGVVGVSDITPLAMHYNETYDPETEPDCIQAVIDGSGNGKVGVEDVTQLAQYFGNEFALYTIQGGDQQQGPFTQIYEAELPADGRSDARLAFTHNLFDIPDYTYWRVVPLDSANNPGEASNVVALNVEAPVRVLGVTPLSGLAGADVTFTAFIAGTGPFTYEWDFGTGATPNVSTAAQPTVTLSVNGEYPAQVKVTGANGSATRHFTLTVTPLPGNPPVINSVGPFSGLSGEQLNFSADISGDEPLTYSWEFDGGASPPVSADVNPTAILSRGGTLPAPNKDYACRLTVSNPSGSASADFTLTVTAQWHVENLPYAPYTNKDAVRSLCFSCDGVLCGVSSYYVTESGQTVVALERYINGQWVMEPVTTGNYTPSFEGWNLCFTSHGSPVIAWGDDKDNAVHLARKVGDSWQHEAISLGGGFWPITKLMLDSQDRAVIAYCYFTGSGTEGAFKIARQNGASWDIFDYPIASPLDQVAMCADDRIIVVNNADNELQARLFVETDEGWDSHLIVESPEGGIAYPMSLSIDASGLAHMIVGGSGLGILIGREKPGFTFEFDPIAPPDDGILYEQNLYLTSQLGELVLYVPIDTWDLITISWKSGDTWEYLQAPIKASRPYAHLLEHPGGHIVLENLAQMAAYW